MEWAGQRCGQHHIPNARKWRLTKGNKSFSVRASKGSPRLSENAWWCLLELLKYIQRRKDGVKFPNAVGKAMAGV